MGNTTPSPFTTHERLENDDERYFAKVAARNKIQTRDFTISNSTKTELLSHPPNKQKTKITALRKMLKKKNSGRDRNGGGNGGSNNSQQHYSSSISPMNSSHHSNSNFSSLSKSNNPNIDTTMTGIRARVGMLEQATTTTTISPAAAATLATTTSHAMTKHNKKRQKKKKKKKKVTDGGGGGGTGGVLLPPPLPHPRGSAPVRRTPHGPPPSQQPPVPSSSSSPMENLFNPTSSPSPSPLTTTDTLFPPTAPIYHTLTRPSKITSLSFHSSNQIIGITSDDGSILLTSTLDFSQTKELQREGKVRSFAWSPCGRYFCVGGDDGAAAVVDGRSMVILGEVEREDRIYAVEWSPDGRRVAIGGFDGLVAICAVDVEGNGDGPVLELLSEIPRAGLVLSLDWSPDGLCLAVGGSDKKAAIVDLESHEVVGEIVRRGSVQVVKWSRCGMFLAIGGHDGYVAVVDVEGRSIVAEIGPDFNGGEREEKEVAGSGGAGRVTDVSWSPDGSFLAIGGHDGVCRIVETNSFVTVHEVKREGGVTCVDWQYEGKYLAVGSDDKTVAFVKTGGMMSSRMDDANNPAVDNNDNNELSSYDGSSVTESTGDNTPLPHWVTTQQDENLPPSRTTTPISLTPSSVSSSIISLLSFSKGSKYLAITTSTPTLPPKLLILSTLDYTPVAIHTLPKPPSSLSWSSTSHFLSIATGSTLTILSTPSFSPLFTTTLPSPILSLSFSPFSSHLAIGLRDGRVTILSSQNWTIVSEIDGEEDVMVTCLDWTETLIGIGRGDGGWVVHEVESVMGNFFVGVLEGRVEGDAGVLCLQFARGGAYLAIGGTDHTVSIHHVSSTKRGAIAHTLQVEGIPQSLAWSPDSRFLCIGTTNPGGLVILNTHQQNPVALPHTSENGGVMVSFSDGGKCLAASSEKSVVLYNPQGFQVIRTIHGLDEMQQQQQQRHNISSSPSRTTPPPSAHSLSDTTSTNKTPPPPQDNNNVQSILDDLAGAHNSSFTTTSSHPNQQQPNHSHTTTTANHQRKKSNSIIKQIKPWSERHDIHTFLSTAEAFLSPYEFDHPPRDLRLFVASVLMLQWHVKWISSLQHEIRETVAMQDDGEPLNCLCRILGESVGIMERIMEEDGDGSQDEDDENRGGVGQWFWERRLFELGRGEVRRLMAWNSWWRQCYGDAPLVDVGLLQRVEDQGRMRMMEEMDRQRGEQMQQQEQMQLQQQQRQRLQGGDDWFDNGF